MRPLFKFSDMETLPQLLVIDLRKGSSTTSGGKLWSGVQEPTHRQVPSNFKMNGGGKVAIDFSSMGLDVAATIEFKGSVSSKSCVHLPIFYGPLTPVYLNYYRFQLGSSSKIMSYLTHSWQVEA